MWNLNHNLNSRVSFYPSQEWKFKNVARGQTQQVLFVRENYTSSSCRLACAILCSNSTLCTLISNWKNNEKWWSDGSDLTTSFFHFTFVRLMIETALHFPNLSPARIFLYLVISDLVVSRKHRNDKDSQMRNVPRADRHWILPFSRFHFAPVIC